MNVKNNQRYKMSSEKIEDAFLTLLLHNRYEDITISQICLEAKINRSTFYCHYDDINDLTIKIEKKFAKSTAGIFNFGERSNQQAFIEMFNFVKENKNFYKAFLNLPYSTFAEKDTKVEVLKNIAEKSNIQQEGKRIDLYYRASFFGAGIKEVCRLWLDRDCKESVEFMATLFLEEYAGREY
jgi:hypothetical protein